jgi:hypothetical protein
MAKKTAKAIVAPAEIEVVSKPGLGIDEGIVITTFILLVLAIFAVYVANQHYAPGA